MAQGRFDQGVRAGAAVLREEPLLQGSGIHPDPQRRVPFQQGLEHHTEPAFASQVAGIDPDLVHPPLERGQSETVIEVDVRHEGHFEVILQKIERGQGLPVRDGHTHHLATRLDEAFGLVQGGFPVAGERGGHGLHQDGGAPTDDGTSNLDRACGLSFRRHGILFSFTGRTVFE